MTDIAATDPDAFTKGVSTLAVLGNNIAHEVRALDRLRKRGVYSFSQDENGGSQFKGKGERARLLQEAMVDWATDNFAEDSIYLEKVEDAIEGFDKYGDFQGGPSPGLFKILGGNLKRLTANRLKLIAAQLQMAYMAAAASGQTGRTLSDRDLAFFLQIVGFDIASDAQAVANTAMSFLDKTINRFDSKAKLSKYYGEGSQEEIASTIRTFGGDPKSNDLDVLNRATGGTWGIFFKWNKDKEQWEFKKYMDRATKHTYLAPVLGDTGYYRQWLTGRGLFEGPGLGLSEKQQRARQVRTSIPQALDSDVDVIRDAIEANKETTEAGVRQGG